MEKGIDSRNARLLNGAALAAQAYAVNWFRRSRAGNVDLAGCDASAIALQ